MFAIDIDRREEFGRAHAERFAEHPPVTTMVAVSRRRRADLLIEVEADAIVDDPANKTSS